MVVTATGVTNRLAEHALTLQFEALPPEVVQQTKGLFMDFLAVALEGGRWPSRPRRLCKAWSI